METLTIAIADIKENQSFPGDVFEFQDTSEQRSITGDVSKDTWAIETVVMDESTKDYLRAFYRARRGHFEAFLWTCPIDSQEYTVYFGKDSFNLRAHSDKVNWVASFMLRRVTT